jgi:hypothetical protein
MIIGPSELNIYKYPGPSASSMVLRVLPTMTLRMFRLKVWKAVKTSRSPYRSVDMRLRMADGTLAELSTTEDEHDLAWLGFENDSDVIFNVQE